MSPDGDKHPIGFKVRFGSGGEKRAEEVAAGLFMPPILEEDDSLPPGEVVLDVSYEDGDVDTGVDPEQFLD